MVKQTTEDCFCKKPIRNTCGRIWNPRLQLGFYNVLLPSTKQASTNILGGNKIYATSHTTNFGRFGQLPSNSKGHIKDCAIFCTACRPNTGKATFRIGHCSTVRDGPITRVGTKSNDSITPVATIARCGHCGNQARWQNHPVQNCQSQNKRNFACWSGILGVLTCEHNCGTICRHQTVVHNARFAKKLCYSYKQTI